MTALKGLFLEKWLEGTVCRNWRFSGGVLNCDPVLGREGGVLLFLESLKTGRGVRQKGEQGIF